MKDKETTVTGFCSECDAYTDELVNCPECADWYCDSCTQSEHDHDNHYFWESVDGEPFAEYDDTSFDHTNDPRDFLSDDPTDSK